MHWRVFFKLMDIQKKMADLSEDKKLNIFDLIYEPYELFTDVRKRNQIELTKSVVFELKQDFNKMFEDLKRAKDNALDEIEEKNE